MSHQLKAENTLILQDQSDLIKRLIYQELEKTIGRRKATLQTELLSNISILRIEFMCLQNCSIKNLKFVKKSLERNMLQEILC